MRKLIGAIVVLILSGPLLEAKKGIGVEPQAGHGSLAVEIKRPPYGTGHANRSGSVVISSVYFIRLDGDARELDEGDMFVSNYAGGYRVPGKELFTTGKSGRWYLLNAEPGRYAVVGLLVGTAEKAFDDHRDAGVEQGYVVVSSYSLFFSEDLIPQTEATVTEGRVTFMGKITYKVGGPLAGSKIKKRYVGSAQWHYYSRMFPDEAKEVESGEFWSQLNNLPARSAKQEAVVRDIESTRDFWDRAIKKDFQNDPLWLDLVQRETDGRKTGD